MKIREDQCEDGQRLSQAHVVCQDAAQHAEILVILAIRHPGEGVHLVRVQLGGHGFAGLLSRKFVM